MSTKLAVAAVSIPHLAGTILRFTLIREHVNKRVGNKAFLDEKQVEVSGHDANANASSRILVGIAMGSGTEVARES